MKILHIYKDYYPVLGGIENHVRMLAEGQAARGHEVSVLVTSRDRRTHEEMRNGVRVIYAARLTTISSTPVSLAMPGLLARERPDIVHLQFPYPFGETANYFFGHGHKTIITYQSDIVRQRFLRVLYAPLMGSVLKQVGKIIATSPNYVTTSPVLARWRDKCTVVPLGIDPAPFIAPPPPRLLTGVEGGLLFVGRLRYYKGLGYLLYAMRELTGVQLVVVGSGPRGREWQQLAQRLGISDRVNFVGDVADADLPSFYAACQVFVLPACERSEAFGLVQLEAMAAAKPVVSCDVGTGVAWVNQDGVTGLVVPPRDPAALAAALKSLLGDRALAAEMGAAGRRRVLAEFTQNRMVERVIDVYEKEFDL